MPQAESIPQVQLYQLTGYIVDFIQVRIYVCLLACNLKVEKLQEIYVRMYT